MLDKPLYIKIKPSFYFLIIIFTIVADQVTKFLAMSNIGLGNETAFIPGFMRFYVVQNTGGAFSLLDNYPMLFMTIGVLNILLFSYLIFINKEYLVPSSKIGASFILGGTLGNLIDRVRVGAVTDFMDFQFMDFAIFNVADACIDIGVIILISGLIYQESSSQKA